MHETEARARILAEYNQYLVQDQGDWSIDPTARTSERGVSVRGGTVIVHTLGDADMVDVVLRLDTERENAARREDPDAVISCDSGIIEVMSLTADSDECEVSVTPGRSYACWITRSREDMTKGFSHSPFDELDETHEIVLQEWPMQ